MTPNRIPKVVLHWTPPDMRKRGRTRTTSRSAISLEMEEWVFLSARLSTLQRTEKDGSKMVMPYVPSGMKRKSK